MSESECQSALQVRFHNLNPSEETPFFPVMEDYQGRMTLEGAAYKPSVPFSPSNPVPKKYLPDPMS